jgi:hypothetical protein
VVIDLNANDDYEDGYVNNDYKFNEEFGYQQLIKTVITKIDHQSICKFVDAQAANEYQDVFSFFTSCLKESLSLNKP